MTTVTKYTTPHAAGAEVNARAERHMGTKGGSYQDAVHAVLTADPDLARAYAQPASRVTTMATKPAVPVPAVPVTSSDEREILDWLMRALKDNMAGGLPGEIGGLAREADQFKRLGLGIEEAARRAMDGNPHLVTAAKLWLADIRRNAPGKANALAQGKTPGETVHLRAQALTETHAELSYAEAVHRVLNQDPALKAAYARV
ncbi:MAG: hypothetical protein M3495_08455 [Pseudomonadota bacterium]|nr:hypothetical protein [Gammaproteobacteria bacterium]MDQ3581627.1 hypothetical protein [Pseudomonadota bacterium]